MTLLWRELKKYERNVGQEELVRLGVTAGLHGVGDHAGRCIHQAACHCT